ncbi:ACP S-malonyltransferase [Metallibacterium scheffleri]|uniref:ACP S-malonyltransferase n=1 Tax=Metallibacterium scheffleri TaxID=993689 RepID=UPI0026EE3AB4|nr:ACP S-malonyltransferase [Metallibacterium scheffleri]
MNAVSPVQNPESRAPNLAFVFPGQGSQAVGMLSALAAQHAEIKTVFGEASAAVGHDLWALAQHGPEDQLNRTEHTQPALLAAGIAVWRVWRKLGGALPELMAGHSLGEYTALVAAEALELGEAAALVAERGRLMQEAVPQGEGAMAALLGGDDAVIAEVCMQVAEGQIVAPANFNAPGQTVIAGQTDAVERALVLLAERGVRKAVRLPVSVPSHCELMRDASARLAERMASIAWRMPVVPVIQNVEARAYGSIEYIRAALERQLYMPVRWTDSMQALAALGVTRVAECGPGKVLSGLLKRIDKSIDVRALGMPADLDAALGAWRVAHD